MNASLRALARRIPFVRDIARKIRDHKAAYRYKNEFLQKIDSAEHNAVTFVSDGMPIPPIRLRDMVRKGAIMAEDFVLEGRQVHQCLLQMAADTGEPIVPSTKLFEFGVGCGRVARHFIASGAENFIGSDVDQELVDWCNSHLASTEGSRFIRNAYQPPILVADSSQDLVYSISVFTHMTEESQHAWAAEMRRIIRPGGRLLVSFLERPSSELSGGVGVNKRIDREFIRTWLGEDGAPSVYFNTFNTRDHFASLFAASFELLLYKKNIVRNTQSMLVLRRIDDGVFLGNDIKSKI